MVLFIKTKTVAEKMLEDIKTFLFFLNIFVQGVFFIYYTYSVVVNLNRPIFCIIYSVLFILSIIAFVNYLVTQKYPKESLKGFSRFLRIFKYAVNFSLIAINFYGIIHFGGTFWNVFLIISSLFSLLFQIQIEVIRYFIEQQIKKFKKNQEERKNNSTEKTANVKTKLTKIKNKFFK